MAYGWSGGYDSVYTIMGRKVKGQCQGRYHNFSQSCELNCTIRGLKNGVGVQLDKRPHIVLTIVTDIF